MNVNKLIEKALPRAASAGILKDLSEMEQELRQDCDGAGSLAEGLHRINESGGKRLRPLLSRVCWNIGNENKTPIVPLMAMLELMHTSSLIHDDYVDGAQKRRGKETINSREGWQQALRSGDYLLSCAMYRLKVYRGTGINEYLSFVAQEMCLGELQQQAGLFCTKDLSVEEYFTRIRRKTALLMAGACRCGAIAGGCDAETVDALTSYGEALGMAFQIRDDIQDWQNAAGTGKAPLQDLFSGVITLPAIYAMEQNPDLVELFENPKKGMHQIQQLMYYVKTNEKKSIATLSQMGEQAMSALNRIPKCPEREALYLLVKTITEVK